MFGIGGGAFAGTLLVELGLLPHVIAATTAVLVLFSAAAAVVKYSFVVTLVFNDFTILCFLLGLVITFIAQWGIVGEMRKVAKSDIDGACGSFRMHVLLTCPPITCAVVAARTHALTGWVHRSGRASWIIISIAGTVGLGAALMTFLAVKLTVQDAGDG